MPTASPPLRAASALALALLLAAGSARADGAFPDSLGLMLPLSKPDHLVLSTNFGVLVSTDNGANWHLVCETVSGRYAWLFQMGPAPAHRLYSMSLDGLLFSDDFGCSWTRSVDSPPSRPVSDVYPDPSDPGRVLIWSNLTLDGGAVTGALYESSNGGLNFGPASLTLAPNQAATGVEISVKDPNVAYATWHERGKQPFLGRTVNGGDGWTVMDLTSSLGEVIPRILLVDPQEPGKVYLRLSGLGVDSLGIVEDGGQSARVALQLDTRMTAFLRRPDGGLIVSTGDGRSWRSAADGGFESWGPTLRFRALNQRGNVIFAGTDDVADNFAVARSDDDGKSWTPLLKFDQIRGIKACGDLANSCQQDWISVKQQFGIYESADGGTLADGGSGGGAGGGTGGAGGGAGGGSTEPDRPRGPCGCGAAPAWLLPGVFFVWAVRRRRIHP